MERLNGLTDEEFAGIVAAQNDLGFTPDVGLPTSINANDREPFINPAPPASSAEPTASSSYVVRLGSRKMEGLECNGNNGNGTQSRGFHIDLEAGKTDGNVGLMQELLKMGNTIANQGPGDLVSNGNEPRGADGAITVQTGTDPFPNPKQARDLDTGGGANFEQNANGPETLAKDVGGSSKASSQDWRHVPEAGRTRSDISNQGLTNYGMFM